MAKQEYLGIEIDLSRDDLFDELGIQRLKESYMRDDEESPQQRFAFVSSKFGSNPEHAQTTLRLRIQALVVLLDTYPRIRANE